ncbi:hypothetical protein D3874_25270 [Oleomonas cavernae]|uniref:Calcineurin-like phosphoesterase domain-containing protein n=1 Tax=Oleomonas cavernae TaxID=2320859 RepID=A0A418VTI3_9PROT|nr:hypothetical protein D3874_25270 [Oleomonas cavernae]
MNPARSSPGNRQVEQWGPRGRSRPLAGRRRDENRSGFRQPPSPVVGAFGDNWLAIKAWIASMRPDMVVHLGDITAYGDEDPAELAQAFQALNSGDWEKRFLPGNHDMGDNRRGPAWLGTATGRPRASAALPRVFGPDRWSFGPVPGRSWASTPSFSAPASTRRRRSLPGSRRRLEHPRARWA